MGYFIDLSGWSLEAFRKNLQEEELLPSQRILLEKIDERFTILGSMNIQNLEDLVQALRTKKDIAGFSAKSSIPEEYLTVLRRTVNSYQPTPRKLSDFTDISRATTGSLANKGYQTSADLFEIVSKRSTRELLGREIGSPPDEMALLAKLLDLTRMRYVNPAFASLLVHAGYDTIEKIRKTEPEKMFDIIIVVNREQDIYRGKIGRKDMAFLIREAMRVPVDLES